MRAHFQQNHKIVGFSDWVSNLSIYEINPRGYTSPGGSKELTIHCPFTAFHPPFIVLLLPFCCPYTLLPLS